MEDKESKKHEKHEDKADDSKLEKADENKEKCENWYVMLLIFSNCLYDKKVIFMHSLHCKKYNKLCGQCNQLISIDEEEEHMETHKRKIEEDKKDVRKDDKKIEQCEGCLRKFFKDKIDLHYKKCKYRLKKCKYCELAVSPDDLFDHEYNCGSKTDYCDDCKKILLVKDLHGHREFLCKKRVKKSDSPRKNTPQESSNIHKDRLTSGYSKYHKSEEIKADEANLNDENDYIEKIKSELISIDYMESLIRK